MVTAAEISPELVLVSPELAERARASLPDRPWEMFVPRLPPRPIPLGAATPPTSRRSWPGRVASALPALLIGGFVAVVVVGSLPWLGERPTLGPPPPRVQPAHVFTTPIVPRAVPDTTTRQAASRGPSGPVSRRHAGTRR